MKHNLTDETNKFGTLSYFKGGFIFSINFKNIYSKNHDQFILNKSMKLYQIF